MTKSEMLNKISEIVSFYEEQNNNEYIVGIEVDIIDVCSSQVHEIWYYNGEQMLFLNKENKKSESR